MIPFNSLFSKPNSCNTNTHTQMKSASREPRWILRLWWLGIMPFLSFRMISLLVVAIWATWEVTWQGYLGQSRITSSRRKSYILFKKINKQPWSCSLKPAASLCSWVSRTCLPCFSLFMRSSKSLPVDGVICLARQAGTVYNKLF